MPHLTPTLLAALKVGVAADPVANGYMLAGDIPSLQGWLNAPSNVSAWRAQIAGSEIYAAHNPVEYIARSTAERSALDLMCAQDRLDCTRAAIRKAIVDIFSGGANSTSRSAVLIAMTEFSTNAERILGGVPATTDTITAVIRVWPGRVTVEEANKLPFIVGA